MATIFDGVSAANPQRSTFDLSHDRKYTVKAGDLTPILCTEVVPGDKFNISMQHLLRLIPMVGPTMHKIDMDVHLFYVPNRIIWKNWEKFITGSRLAGADSGLVPVHPFIDAVNYTSNVDTNSFTTGYLLDYLGYPVFEFESPFADVLGKKFKVNSLPIRAYYKIWSEFYRDQNLQPGEWLDDLYDNDGDDYDFWHSAPQIFKLEKRAWEKDYFTSALPFVQKGSPLTVPIQGTLALQHDGNPTNLKYADGVSEFANVNNPISGARKAAPNTDTAELRANNEGAGAGLYVDPSGYSIDLSGADVVTINELRAAFQAQLWLERNARAGTRYIESLEAHFGVRPADYRLQRPELFGAMRVPVQMSEVLQTSETATSPQGNMAGHGIAYGKDSFSVFCPEHGWIIAIASIKPRTSYMSAVNKSIFRLDYLEYLWPEFARLGEQEIKRKELGFENSGMPLSDTEIDLAEETFGYQSRYAEYRSAFSTVHGGMRSDSILKNWHMARENVDFRSNLSEEFILADPTSRIFADTTPEFEYIVHTQFRIMAKRPLPYFTDPGFIDHP